MYICVCIFMHRYIYVCICMYMYVYANICMHMYVYVSVCVCMYNGATLDVMVAFSRRPIVLSSREEELLSTRLLDHLSLVATTSPHDRTASVFIQYLQIGSKKQSVWFTPFVRANPCHVCVFVCVCITTEMPGDCCLCSSICLDVPSRQRRL